MEFKGSTNLGENPGELPFSMYGVKNVCIVYLVVLIYTTTLVSLSVMCGRGDIH